MKIIHLAAPILSIALTVPAVCLRAQQNDPQQNTQQQQQNPPQQQYNPQQPNAQQQQPYPQQQQPYNPQQPNAQQQQQQYPQQQQPYDSQQQNRQPQQPYNQQQQYGNQQQQYGNQQQQYAAQQRQDTDQRSGQWDTPPPNYSDIGRRGFQDGVDAARNDFASRADMNPRRSPMYRHPPVDHHARDEYRNSFMHGYNMSMQHTGITHDHHHDDDDHR